MSIDIANNKCEMVESIYSSPNILRFFSHFPGGLYQLRAAESLRICTIAPRKIDPLPT